MLRHRLLLWVVPLVCVLLATAIVGVWLMEGTLDQVNYLNDTVMVTMEKANDFVIAIRDIRRGLNELQLGHKDQGQIPAAMKSAVQLLADIHESPIVQQSAIRPRLQSVDRQMPAFQALIDGLFGPNANVTPVRTDAAMKAANALDGVATPIGQMVRDQAHTEHQELSSRFRWLVLSIAAVSMVAINMLILVLLRMASMILPPVDALVQAARELGREHFDTRVQWTGVDEFGQLARAYNQMAEQLQAAEGRRIEVLGQVALALNHEMNNIINIIELQLKLVKRHAGDSDALEENLRQIADGLARMTRAVSALRQARRIILTDYVGGAKMLDLERSAQAIEPSGQPA
ncbi:MAG TPA: HAMP domain-containing protein [Tepidisphaeraceae bacterium]|nr:HAMP domain-containing protein [Tepidisphaeraceae bacterium]